VKDIPKDMNFKEYKYLILSDLYRHVGEATLSSLIHQLIFGESYKYNFWMRTCAFSIRQPLLRSTLYPLARLMWKHYMYKLGIAIDPSTEIGGGFYIGHFGGIVVHEKCRIGKNCNIHQGVTLGVANRGRNKGCPSIGDNVYIGPGAKIFGNVRIGHNAAIGANAVVTKDVPDDAVVVGIPGKVISHEGSAGYVNKTDYEDRIG
jgi:serine O-acetyltransferase